MFLCMYVKTTAMADPKLIYSTSRYNSSFAFMIKNTFPFVNSFFFFAGVKTDLDEL